MDLTSQQRAYQSGFLLLEVLITIAILAIGLLGISAMLSVSLKSGGAAIERGEISMIMGSIAGRMRANTPDSITNGNYNITNKAVPASLANCKTVDPGNSSQVALNDICDFLADIQDTLGNNQNPKATISCNTNRICSYAISWHDNVSKTSLENDYDSDPNNTEINRTYTYSTTVMF